MEIVYYTEVNIGRFEQNSGIIIIYGKDHIFSLSCVEQMFSNKV
jgi:hypothetical protein